MTKFFVLVSLIGLASTCAVQAQIAVPAQLPAESLSPRKKTSFSSLQGLIFHRASSARVHNLSIIFWLNQEN